MQTAALEGGFSDAPVQSARAFRAVMTAMARPADIQTLHGAAPPAPLSPAAGAIVLTLCDPETPLYLAPSYDLAPLRDWITFHTGAPLVPAAQAQFAIGAWGELPLGAFRIGTAEYPDRSATVIVEMAQIEARGAVLSGAGIKDEAQLSLPETAAFQSNAALFPLGLDFFFTAGAQVAALPRSTKVR